MTGDFKQNIEDDYHLKVGGILYKLAVAEDFTADVSSGGPFSRRAYAGIRQLSMNLLLTVTNTRYRFYYNFKFPEQLPHRGSNCAPRVSSETSRFASRDLKRESRWLSEELNCIEQ